MINKSLVSIQVDLALLQIQQRKSEVNEREYGKISYLREISSAFLNIPRQCGKTTEIVRRSTSKDVIVVRHPMIRESFLSMLEYRNHEDPFSAPKPDLEIPRVLVADKDKHTFWSDLMVAEDLIGGIDTIYLDDFGFYLQAVEHLFAYNFKKTPKIIGLGTTWRTT